MEKSPLTIKSLGAVKYKASIRRKTEEEERILRKNKKRRKRS